MTREQGKGFKERNGRPESWLHAPGKGRRREELRFMSFFKDLYPMPFSSLPFDSGVGGKSYFGLRFYAEGNSEKRDGLDKLTRS